MTITKKTIAISIGIFLLIVIIFFGFYLVKRESSLTLDNGQSVTNSKNKVKLDNTNLSVLAYTEKVNNSEDERVNIVINVFPNIISFNEIKEVEISNIKLIGGLSDKFGYTTLFPKHIKAGEAQYNSYFEIASTNPPIADVQFSKADSQIYKAVEVTSDNPWGYMDEIGNSGGTTRFNVYIPNIATINSNRISQENKVYDGGWVLQYGKIKDTDLNLTLSYTVTVRYSDGTKTSIGVSDKIDGTELYKVGYFSKTNTDLLNKEF